MVELNNGNFNEFVFKKDKLVIVDFNATWCGPCRMLKPILEDVEKEHDEISFGSVDVDKEKLLSEEYGVSSIPCLIFFKDGVEVSRSIGLKSKEDLEKMIGDLDV